MKIGEFVRWIIVAEDGTKQTREGRVVSFDNETIVIVNSFGNIIFLQATAEQP